MESLSIFFKKLPNRLRGRYQWLIQKLCKYLLPLTQRFGFSIVPVYYDQPVIDLSALREGYWRETTDLIGIDLQLEKQCEWLAKIRSEFAQEYDSLPQTQKGKPHEFFVQNGGFESVDAEAYYALIREKKPSKIVEIGCGNSTFLAATAVRKNQSEGSECELWAIDPYLKPPLDQGFPGLSGVRAEKVEEIPLDDLLDLNPGDFFLSLIHI